MKKDIGTMSLRICICDDEEFNVLLLQRILASYFKDRKVVCDIITYPNGLSLLHDFKDGCTYPDVLFMDIMLGDSNGVDICKEMRKGGYTGTIIFLTGSSEYAVSGYELDARGYILKPYKAKLIHETLDRVLNNSGNVAYTIKNYNRIIRIPIADIFYIESQNTKCVMHCMGDLTYTLYKKLGDIEQELSGNGFLRCHRSYLVNMAAIVSADSDFTLTNGDTVPIRTKNSKEIKDEYMSYLDMFK